MFVINGACFVMLLTHLQLVQRVEKMVAMEEREAFDESNGGTVSARKDSDTGKSRF